MSRAAAAAPAPRLVLGLGSRTARLQELGPALPTAREALAWLGTALEHRSACSGAAGRGPHAAEPAQDKPSSARGSGRAAHTQVPHGLSHQTAQADACVGRSKPEATPGAPLSGAAPQRPLRGRAGNTEPQCPVPAPCASALSLCPRASSQTRAVPPRTAEHLLQTEPALGCRNLLQRF